MATKAEVNKEYHVKLNNFYTEKEPTNKTKIQTSKWKKIFENGISDKRLLSKMKSVQKVHSQPCTMKGRDIY